MNKVENKKEVCQHNYRDMSLEELQVLFQDKTVSKNQRKKIKKEIDWIRKKEERKVERRKRKIEKKNQKKSVLAKQTENSEGGDQAENEVAVKKPRLNKVKTTENFEENFHLAIDCSFDELMNNKDIRKLAGQIGWSYKINRRCNTPVQYHLFGASSLLTSRFDPTFSNWDIHFDDKLCELSTEMKKNVVYLTAESPNVLDEVKKGTLYVIGGFVDHNHHKGHCHKLAVEAGYQTARLPLSEHVEMKSRSVLTVNHVFELLLAMIELKDWKQSILKVLPPKKYQSAES